MSDFDARVQALAAAGDVLAREVLRLRAELAVKDELLLAQAERIKEQSELLSKRAEK
jgi:hypothetical protein